MAGLALEPILSAAIEAGASDLHLTPGLPPIARLAGALAPLGAMGTLQASDTARMAAWMLGHPPDESDHDVAFSFGPCRFRANIYRQRAGTTIACRALPLEVPGLESLGLPTMVRTFIELRHGLVLLCGPTGSGKSTTLAAIIDQINRSRSVHITTIEDPIEYIHTEDRSLIHQREIGSDVRSFASALRSALRQDPDVILVGEMRDQETIDAALTAAETGHLVLSTLHTGDVASSISRVINVFPNARQAEARTRLATVLHSIVCQKLLPRLDDPRRLGVVAEILVNTKAVATLIRNGDSHQLASVLETGSRDGMQTFERALADAIAQGWLDPAIARASTQDGRSLDGHLLAP